MSNNHHLPYESGSEGGSSIRSQSRVTFSGPLTTTSYKSNRDSRSSARVDDDDDGYVEITLDVRDDSVSVQDIKGAVDNQEAALLASQLERHRPSQGLTSQLSAKLRQVSRELMRVTSSNRGPKQLDRTKTTAARALRGLRFIEKSVGAEGWADVEKRFDKLAVDGLLLRSRFGQCIGMSRLFLFFSFFFFPKKKKNTFPHTIQENY